MPSIADCIIYTKSPNFGRDPNLTKSRPINVAAAFPVNTFQVRVFIPLERRLAIVVSTAATMITAPVDA